MTSCSYNSLLVYYKGMGRETLEQLYMLYKTDFDAFGYTIPEKFSKTWLLMVIVHRQKKIIIL